MLERRDNDKIILEEIRSLQKDVGGIQINLALNTQKTSELAEYQKYQNGRLTTMESRTQAVEGAQAITSTAVAAIQQNDKKDDEREEELRKARNARYDKLLWIGIGLLITLIGNITLFLIRSDILKKIFIQ